MSYNNKSELIAEQLMSAELNRRTWEGMGYNVSAYGLVGDGVTDNTAKLQALINLAIITGVKTIVFFPGIFKVTGLTNANQVTFIGDAASFVGGYGGIILPLGEVPLQLAMVEQDIVVLENGKADKSYVDTLISTIGNATPKGAYATLSALQSAWPVGTTGIYVVSADGNWYFWNGSAWTPGGVYQSTTLADGAVTPAQTTFISISPNLFDKSQALQNKQVAGSGNDMYTLTTPGNNLIWASPIIPVMPNTLYKANSKSTAGGFSVACFTDTGAYIKGLTATLSGGNYQLTTESTMHFIRFTFSSLELNRETFMFVKGSTMPTTYEPYYKLLDNYLIQPLIDRVGALENSSTPSLHVPLRFDFIKGTIGEIFDFGVMDFNNYPVEYCLNLESSGSWGTRHTNNRFLLDFTSSTPTAITKKFHLDNINTGERLVEATTVISVVDVIPNPGTTKNILMMGDSFVAYGDILSDFNTKLHTTYGLTNYPLVGSKSKNGVKHEGVAGYDWANFTDSSSIFYNPTVSRLDFINYMSTYCSGVSLDYVICVLGVNDFSHGHTISQVSTMVLAFLDRLHIDYPSCKIILVGQHKQPYQSYFNGDYYGVGKGKWMIQLNGLYHDIALSRAAYVKYVSMIAQFDYDNGFTMDGESVGRYSPTKPYITDSTHPSAEVGAKYYADGILAGFFAINQ